MVVSRRFSRFRQRKVLYEKLGFIKVVFMSSEPNLYAKVAFLADIHSVHFYKSTNL